MIFYYFILMRSIRYRKLMEGAKRLAQGQSLMFQIKANETTSCSCQLEIWREDMFHQIEKGPSAKQLLFQFKEWVEMPPEMMGKKSNEIALSKSRLYCLKNISFEDLEQFQRIFEDYLKFKATSQSLLVPIYALVSIHSTISPKSKWTDSFIFMPNLSKGDAIIFDIKGYCDSRYVELRDYKDFKFGKDQNFIKSQFLPMVESLPLEIRQNIFASINTNLSFLKKINVIDYSLLLIFKPRANNQKPQDESMIILNEKYSMRMNIIDFFQIYNERKKLENKFKSLFFKEISSVDPLTYANRLLDFAKKVLLIK